MADEEIYPLMLFNDTGGYLIVHDAEEESAFTAGGEWRRHANMQPQTPAPAKKAASKKSAE